MDEKMEASVNNSTSNITVLGESKTPNEEKAEEASSEPSNEFKLISHSNQKNFQGASGNGKCSVQDSESGSLSMNKPLAGNFLLEKQSSINDVDAAEILIDIQSSSLNFDKDGNLIKKGSTNSPKPLVNATKDTSFHMNEDDRKIDSLKNDIEMCENDGSSSTQSCEPIEMKASDMSAESELAVSQIVGSLNSDISDMYENDSLQPLLSSEAKIDEITPNTTTQGKNMEATDADLIVETAKDNGDNNILDKKDAGVVGKCEHRLEVFDEDDSHFEVKEKDDIENAVKYPKVNMNVSDLVKASEKIIGANLKQREESPMRIKNEKTLMPSTGVAEATVSSSTNLCSESRRDGFDVDDAGDLLIAFANKVHHVAEQEKNVSRETKVDSNPSEKEEHNIEECNGKDIPDEKVIPDENGIESSDNAAVPSQDQEFSKTERIDNNDGNGEVNNGKEVTRTAGRDLKMFDYINENDHGNTNGKDEKRDVASFQPSKDLKKVLSMETDKTLKLNTDKKSNSQNIVSNEIFSSSSSSEDNSVSTLTKPSTCKKYLAEEVTHLPCGNDSEEVMDMGDSFERNVYEKVMDELVMKVENALRENGSKNARLTEPSNCDLTSTEECKSHVPQTDSFSGNQTSPEECKLQVHQSDSGSGNEISIEESETSKDGMRSCVKLVQDICDALAPDIKKIDDRQQLHIKKDYVVPKLSHNSDSKVSPLENSKILEQKDMESKLDHVSSTNVNVNARNMLPDDSCVDESSTMETDLQIVTDEENRKEEKTAVKSDSVVTEPIKIEICDTEDGNVCNDVHKTNEKTDFICPKLSSTSGDYENYASIDRNVNNVENTSTQSLTSTVSTKDNSSPFDPSLLRQEMLKLLPELLLEVCQTSPSGIAVPKVHSGKGESRMQETLNEKHQVVNNPVSSVSVGFNSHNNASKSINMFLSAVSSQLSSTISSINASIGREKDLVEKSTSGKDGAMFSKGEDKSKTPLQCLQSLARSSFVGSSALVEKETKGYTVSTTALADVSLFPENRIMKTSSLSTVSIQSNLTAIFPKVSGSYNLRFQPMASSLFLPIATAKQSPTMFQPATSFLTPNQVASFRMSNVIPVTSNSISHGSNVFSSLAAPPSHIRVVRPTATNIYSLAVSPSNESHLKVPSQHLVGLNQLENTLVVCNQKLINAINEGLIDVISSSGHEKFNLSKTITTSDKMERNKNGNELNLRVSTSNQSLSGKRLKKVMNHMNIAMLADKIVDCSKKDDGNLYKVRWEAYTWENEKHLTDSEMVDMLNEYHDRKMTVSQYQQLSKFKKIIPKPTVDGGIHRVPATAIIPKPTVDGGIHRVPATAIMENTFALADGSRPNGRDILTHNYVISTPVDKIMLPLVNQKNDVITSVAATETTKINSLSICSKGACKKSEPSVNSSLSNGSLSVFKASESKVYASVANSMSPHTASLSVFKRGNSQVRATDVPYSTATSSISTSLNRKVSCLDAIPSNNHKEVLKVAVTSSCDIDPLEEFISEPDFFRVKPLILTDDEYNVSYSASASEELNLGITFIEKEMEALEKIPPNVKVSACAHCNSSLTAAILSWHKRIYTTYPCPKCNIRMCNWRKLAKHIVSHSTFAYQCDVCCKGFNEQFKLKAHQEKKHAKKALCKVDQQNKRKTIGGFDNLVDKISCSGCGKKFRNRLSLIKHQRMRCYSNHSSPDINVCIVCQKRFRSKEKLELHTSLHQISYKECVICEEIFDVDEDDKAHECTGTPFIKFVYNYEKLVENYNVRRKQNRRKRHREDRIKKSKVCVRCSMGFGNRDDFYEHINSTKCPCIRNKSHCFICKEYVQSQIDLKSHIETCFKDSLISLIQPHTKDPAKVADSCKQRCIYHCSRCSVLFPSRHLFQMHKMMHYKSEMYECYNCHFQCYNKKLMKTHLRNKLCISTHSYSCFVCDESKIQYAGFGSLRTLIMHMKSHNLKKKKLKDLLMKATPVKIKNNSGETRYLTVAPEDLKNMLTKPGYCHVPGFGNFKVEVNSFLPYQITAHKLGEVGSKKEGTVTTSNEILNTGIGVVNGRGKIDAVSFEKKEFFREIASGIGNKNKKAKESTNRCFKCALKLSSEKDTLNHFRGFHKWRIIQLHVCSQCNIVFKDKAMYALHSKDCHLSNKPADQHEVLRVETKGGCDCEECKSKESASVPKSVPAVFIKCKECNQNFQCLRQTRHHQAQSHSSQPFVFVCQSCDLPFVDYQLLWKHHSSVHNSSPDFICRVVVVDWPCYICKGAISALGNHAVSHTVVMLECYLCNVKISNKAMLVTHMKNNHNRDWSSADDIWIKAIRENAIHFMVLQLYRNRNTNQSRKVKKSEKITSSVKKDAAVKCSKCAALFFHKATLDRHVVTNSCRLKNIDTTSAQNSLHSKKGVIVEYKLPLTGKKSVEKPPPTKCYRAECSVCSMLFFSKEECALHLKSIHYMDKFKASHILLLPPEGLPSPCEYCCNICRSGFRNQNSLWKHKFEHYDVKLELCYICHRSFSSVMELKVHMLSYHKAFFCMCCFKAFHTISALQEHCQIHVLEVNVPRDENGKMVIDVDDDVNESARERKPLLGERDCLTNKAIFYISSKIPKKHLEDTRLFFCQVCKKNIEGELTLVVHMKTHSVPRRLCCVVCRLTFEDGDELEYHLRKHFDNSDEISKVDIEKEDIDEECDEAIDKCAVCSEVFVSQLELNNHVLANQKQLLKSEIRMGEAISINVEQYVKSKLNPEVNNNSFISQYWVIDWKIAEKYNLDKIFEWWKSQKEKSKHPTVDTRNSYNYYICPYCYVFLKKDNVVQHLPKHMQHLHKYEAQTDMVHCAYCQLFLTHTEMHEHMKTKHGDFYKKFNLLTNVNCQFCSAPLSISEIPMHMMKHKQNLPIITPYIYCVYCDLQMTTEELKVHMKVESEKMKSSEMSQVSQRNVKRLKGANEMKSQGSTATVKGRRTKSEGAVSNDATNYKDSSKLSSRRVSGGNTNEDISIHSGDGKDGTVHFDVASNYSDKNSGKHNRLDNRDEKLERRDVSKKKEVVRNSDEEVDECDERYIGVKDDEVKRSMDRSSENVIRNLSNVKGKEKSEVNSDIRDSSEKGKLGKQEKDNLRLKASNEKQEMRHCTMRLRRKKGSNDYENLGLEKSKDTSNNQGNESINKKDNDLDSDGEESDEAAVSKRSIQIIESVSESKVKVVGKKMILYPAQQPKGRLEKSGSRKRKADEKQERCVKKSADSILVETYERRENKGNTLRNEEEVSTISGEQKNQTSNGRGSEPKNVSRRRSRGNFNSKSDELDKAVAGMAKKAGEDVKSVEMGVDKKHAVEVKRSRRLSMKRNLVTNEGKEREADGESSGDEKAKLLERNKVIRNADELKEVNAFENVTRKSTNKSNVQQEKKVVARKGQMKKETRKVVSVEERMAECKKEVDILILGLMEPKCSICDWRLKDFNELKEHLFKHIYDPIVEIKCGSRDARCALCLKIIRRTSIKTHLVIVHQREVLHQTKLEQSAEWKEKPVPGKVDPFTKIIDVKQAMDAGLQTCLPYPYNCAVCGKGYFTSSPYLNHFKNIHPWLYEGEKEKLSNEKRDKRKFVADEGSSVESTPKKKMKTNRNLVDNASLKGETSRESKSAALLTMANENKSEKEKLRKMDEPTNDVSTDSPSGLLIQRRSTRKKKISEKCRNSTELKKPVLTSTPEGSISKTKSNEVSDICDENSQKDYTSGDEMELQGKLDTPNHASNKTLATKRRVITRSQQNLDSTNLISAMESTSVKDPAVDSENRSASNTKRSRDKGQANKEAAASGDNAQEGGVVTRRGVVFRKKKEEQNAVVISGDSDDSSSSVEEETEEEIIESSSDEEEIGAGIGRKNTKKGALNLRSKSNTSLLVGSNSNSAKIIRDRKTSSDAFPCSQCNILFNTQMELDSHISAHQGNPDRFFNVPYPYVCLFCGNGYYKTQMLKKHLKFKHASYYSDGLEKTPSFMRRATGLQEDYQKFAKPCESAVSLPKRDRSKFAAVLDLVRGKSRSSTEGATREEKMISRGSQDSGEKPVGFERRVSGRRRAISQDVLQVLQGNKSKASPNGEDEKKKSEAEVLGSEEAEKKDENETHIKYNARPTPKRKLIKSQISTAGDEIDNIRDGSVRGADNSENSDSDDADERKNKNALVCKYCDCIIKNSSLLSKHKKMHSRGVKRNSNELMCLCCKKMVVRHELRWHMHISHANDRKVCLSSKKKYCPKCNYYSKKDLEEHIATFHPELLKIECRLCDDRFTSKSLYSLHFKSMHGKSIDEESLMCYLCNKKFRSLPKLHHHYSIVHMKKNENISCSLCSKFFYSQTDLDKHREKFHKNDKFQCGLCLAEFEGLELCEGHVVIHKEKTDYQCSLCNFYFDCEDVLEKHVLTHDTPILTCDDCHRDFNNLSEYQSHKKTHSNNLNNSNFVCGNCNRSFDTETALIEHSREHCVNKTYHCSSCDKKFKYKHEIQAHMDKIHHGGTHAIGSETEPTDEELTTENDDFATINHCKDCGQTFIRPEIFAEHQKKHLSKKRKK